MSVSPLHALEPDEAELSPVAIERDPSRLGDPVLLSGILAGTATPPNLASNLVEGFGSLGGVLSADAGELRRAGLGASAIHRLVCLREAAIRLAREDAARRPVISSWSQLLAYVRTTIAHLPREQFRALYLDRRNCLMREEWVADGSVDHAPVYPRELVRRALELSASAMILVHNHPSGDPSPSTADIDMTRKVIDAARVFNIQVHDHLIVGRDGTASFKSLGLI
ncbi:MAG: DNA repair protein RadC [Brevundimonas sp.]|nr:MAG: DNA repair protein RadC [Brevundimonas sp.]